MSEQSLEGSERVMAKFAHLQVLQARIESEMAARAEVADLDE